MSKNNEVFAEIKSLHESGLNGRQIAIKLKGVISYASISAYIRFNCDIDVYRKHQSEKNNRKMDLYFTKFRNNMEGYTDEEITRARKQFLIPAPLFDVVPCRCTKKKMCYPHYLEHLCKIFDTTKYFYRKS